MKYRTKLLLTLCAIALVTSGASLAILYRQTKGYLLDEMRATLLSIAATTATTIDVTAHESIRARADETSTAYRALEAHLRSLRDANRRKDVYVKFIYTLRKDTTGEGATFVLDAEEDGADKSHVGDIYKFKAAQNQALNFDQPEVFPNFIEDQWGIWLSGTAPLRSATGATVALVGVDIDARDVNRKLGLLIRSGLLAMAAASVLAVLLALALARWVARPLRQIREGVETVARGQLDTQINLHSKDEFGEVAGAIDKMIVGLRQRDNLKSTLVRYVSKDVADKIMAGGDLPVLKSERRKITTLFSDVRGFTSLSEKMAPEQIVLLLNQYFDRMIEAIFRNHGHLNKFIGDGMMVMFGAPQDDAYQEEHAIRAALLMRAEVEKLREQFRREHDCDFLIGIGINTGVAVVGNIGSEQKMEYTAIGDAVNLASRLESATKELKIDILVSEYTYVAVRNQFRFKKHGALAVKGKTDQIQIYEVLGPA